MKDEDMRRNPESIKKWNNTVTKALNVAKEHKLANGKYIILENFFELTENANAELIPNGVCPFLGQEAWFNTRGDFSPCCAPDNLRKGLEISGNINEKNFFEIWNNPAYKELCKNYRDNELCKKCNMRRMA
jgi:radical SAM protein with 4Fe4S-binding SPASM domain